MTEENRQQEQPDQDVEKIEQRVVNGDEGTDEKEAEEEEPKQPATSEPYAVI